MITEDRIRKLIEWAKPWTDAMTWCEDPERPGLYRLGIELGQALAQLVKERDKLHENLAAAALDLDAERNRHNADLGHAATVELRLTDVLDAVHLARDELSEACLDDSWSILDRLDRILEIGRAK